MIELTIMLLILAGMMLAVVMISGIEMRSNTLLLSARNNAQIAARSGDGSAGYETSDEYTNWYYPALRLTKSYINEKNGSFGSSVMLLRSPKKNYRMRSRNAGSLQIPFSYQGDANKDAASGAISDASNALESATYSRQDGSDGKEAYSKWRTLTEIDTSFQHDYSGNVRSMNAFSAAKLVSADGDGGSTPATINRSDQAGTHSVNDAVSVMYKTFSRLFGIDINDMKMQSHETNRVYMPQLK